MQQQQRPLGSLAPGPLSRPASWLTEFKKVTGITALGFIAAGFIGFFIKLIFIVSDLVWAGQATTHFMLSIVTSSLICDHS